VIQEDESLLSNQPVRLPARLKVFAQNYGHSGAPFMGGIQKSKHSSSALTSLGRKKWKHKHANLTILICQIGNFDNRPQHYLFFQLMKSISGFWKKHGL